MADRIRFGVSLTPLETLTDENGGTRDIVASEVGRSLASSGESIALNDYSQAANVQGYKDAAVNYRSASHSAGGTALTSLSPDFLFIKNTGYKYSSATALGASTTDCVMVVLDIPAYANGVQPGWVNDAGAGIDQYVEIAWLKPGQGIVLPFGASNLSITQFGSTAGDLDNAGGYLNYYVRTFLSDGSAASTANAVEFLACT